MAVVNRQATNASPLGVKEKIMPDTIYQIGWDDGFENRGFKPEYCDNDTYRRGFCNGAYFRAITPNNACTG